uniref:ZP domain-containing protein n=1 Tax=Steinernema glaseri TaxID=37863 RepID=A0A1I7YGS2_9BILA
SLILSAPFDRCGISRIAHENGHKYVAHVGFKTKSNVTTKHTVSCLVPFKTNDLTAEFTLPEDEISADDTLSTTVEVTGRQREGFLQTYPLNCWLSFENTSSVEEQRRYFIVNGCPVNGTGARISQELVSTSLIKETRFFLPLSPFLDDISSEEKATLQCESILCSGSGADALENVPTVIHPPSLAFSVPPRLALVNRFFIRFETLFMGSRFPRRWVSLLGRSLDSRRPASEVCSDWA